MLLSAKAVFDPKNLDTARTVYRRAETALPSEFVRLYKKNVVAITPRENNGLRRSIVTQAIGGRAEIAWRVPYAKAQDDGGRDGVVYRNYTTPGTGAHFATRAFMATSAQMPEVYRALGLTQ